MRCVRALLTLLMIVVECKSSTVPVSYQPLARAQGPTDEAASLGHGRAYLDVRYNAQVDTMFAPFSFNMAIHRHTTHALSFHTTPGLSQAQSHGVKPP